MDLSQSHRKWEYEGNEDNRRNEFLLHRPFFRDTPPSESTETRNDDFIDSHRWKEDLKKRSHGICGNAHPRIRQLRNERAFVSTDDFQYCRRWSDFVYPPVALPPTATLGGSHDSLESESEPHTYINIATRSPSLNLLDQNACNITYNTATFLSNLIR